MNAIAPTADPSHYFKAVCYKCGHVGLNAERTRCSRCQFPIILETRRVPSHKDSIRDIFDRTSVEIGAPPLPGVDATPRKAQVMAEVRRQRREAIRVAAAEAIVVRRRPTTVSDIVQNPRVRVGFAMVSALVAGFVAAMLNAGM